MITETITIKNPLGIHARPAALLVQKAAKFKSEIFLSKGEVHRINGKSVMGVMMLAAERGSEVVVEADGEDEAEAIAVLAELLGSDFEVQA